MTTTTFECNFQRTPNSRWETREFETAEEARETAEFFAQFTWNCNWQATRPGQDNRPAWTMREGQPQR